MTFLLVVLVLALMAAASLKFGADTREAGGWTFKKNDNLRLTERHV